MSTAAIVPVAMLIALDRSQLAPLGVFTHAVAISAGFMILMASLAHPLAFVVATVLLGVGSVLVTTRGSELRTLGVLLKPAPNQALQPHPLA